MSDKETLKTVVAQTIPDNNSREITPSKVRESLQALIDTTVTKGEIEPILSTMESVEGQIVYLTTQISDMQALVDDKADGGVISSWMGGIEEALLGIQSALSGKVNEVHIHTIAQVTGLQTALDGKQAKITPSEATGNATGGAATDAATNAPTNLNVLTTLLGSLTGEVNATNQKQNQIATKYNDLAAKYNDLAVKFNSILAQLRAQGLKSA